MIAALATLAAPIAAAALIVRLLRLNTLTERVLAFYCIHHAVILACGYALSALKRLGRVDAWALAGLVAVLASAGLNLALRRRGRVEAAVPPWRPDPLTPFEKRLLVPIFATVLILGVANLAVCLFSSPRTYDSMAYHLARAAYYAQHGCIDHFEANYWAQTTHPRNPAILLIHAFLAFGRGENMTQLVQFAAYWASVLSVFGIARRSGLRFAAALFSAGTAALLVVWLMQAVTTQNDLLIASYTGVAAFFLLTHRAAPGAKPLALSALAAALAVGTKSPALLALAALAPLAARVLPAAPDGGRRSWRPAAGLLAWGGLFTVLFALPSGYLDNLRRFGHPVGLEETRKFHSFEGRPPAYVAAHGAQNMIRYGLEFMAPDGLAVVPGVEAINRVFRGGCVYVARRAGLDLEGDEGSRSGFEAYKPPRAHEDYTYWGVLGPALVWPCVLVALFRRRTPAPLRVLAASAALFFVLQSISGPYDPWRGRYFAAAALVAVPVCGLALEARGRVLRTAVTSVVLLGCLSALLAVGFRERRALLPFGPDGRAVFGVPRIEQMCSDYPEVYLKPLTAFAAAVPENAVVAVLLGPNEYEYPLFGPRWTRTLLPVNSFLNGLRRIPDEAQFLLYNDRWYPGGLPADQDLGSGWHLRRLGGHGAGA